MTNPGANASRVASLFTSNASLLFVPTGQHFTASSLISLLKNLDLYSSQDQIVSVTNGASSAVVESVVSLVHDREISWILPDVKPTNRIYS